ncbi:MAG: med21 domain-containing protein [Firmicutes bacterium]|nr:med21 domain-containing protein [Bacillota bacterium]
MTKRIIVLGIALVMLFSVVFFGAGSCQFYDPSRTALLERLAELERRIAELEEETRVLRLPQQRLDAVEELEAYVDELDRGDYANWNWIMIEKYVEAGAEAINVADSSDNIKYELALAKSNIRSVQKREWVYSECGRFTLEIYLWDREPWSDGTPTVSVGLELRNITDKIYYVTVYSSYLYLVHLYNSHNHESAYIKSMQDDPPPMAVDLSFRGWRLSEASCAVYFTNLCCQRQSGILFKLWFI